MKLFLEKRKLTFFIKCSEYGRANHILFCLVNHISMPFYLCSLKYYGTNQVYMDIKLYFTPVKKS